MEQLKTIAIWIAFLPLIAAIVVGFFRKLLGKSGAHWIAISLLAVSTYLSALVLTGFFDGTYKTLDTTLYVWGTTGGLSLQVGFLLDKLTALMMCVVTFVSLMVHIYTIGYMAEDPGYGRFFSYIALFTFAMLMLVMSNNFLQLFFGWEAVGLVSYLLIGFWYQRESAIFANLKAFLVNRVGDFGFLIGIAAILYYFGSLNYASVFNMVGFIAGENPTIQLFIGEPVGIFTFICICLFIGAMGKSAQVPLHVWLPDSMEGPTPISALIHAATMVTAGVFMVARMSPLFEQSEVALSVVLTIGSLTCFFMGLLGVVQNDIKRIIAYSTLSQLGYMMVAQGVSAYAVGMFHLMTHAFFKALLFLGAGSVIIAMHHEQDIRKMGNLKHYMPITYFTMLVGSLALIGFPGLSGFYSKDLIIECVHNSVIPGSELAYWAVLSSVFVTALYSFRLFFLVFHTSERMDLHTRDHLQESPWVVWFPLVALAIPSAISGWYFIDPIFSDFFGKAIQVQATHDVIGLVGANYHGPWAMLVHGLKAPPFYLAIAGVLTAWLAYVKYPNLAILIKEKLSFVHRILENKYGFDQFNQKVLATGTRGLAWFCWRLGDRWLIDGLGVNGSARNVNRLAKLLRHMQTGYLYHYAFAMILGFFALLVWLVLS